MVVGSAGGEAYSVPDAERRKASKQMAQGSGDKSRWPEQAEGNRPQRAEASENRTTHGIREWKWTYPGLDLAVQL